MGLPASYKARIALMEISEERAFSFSPRKGGEKALIIHLMKPGRKI